MENSNNITVELLREVLSNGSDAPIGGNTYNFYNYTNCYNNQDTDDDIYSAELHIDDNDRNTTTSRPNVQTRTTVIPIPLNASGQDISNRIQTTLGNIITGINSPNISDIATRLHIPIDELIAGNDANTATGLDILTLNSGTELSICSTEGDKCGICDELYILQDICRKNTNCGHMFHQACIDTWYSEHSHCPICNQTIV
jgi:hypothetical protein|tara:strand:+ start:118 stop:717 length:600 start_codon:yes stop_codon:yes gene_type:complete